MILKTDRLFLRVLNQDDHQSLIEILSDTETMSHYPSPFSPDKVNIFIENNIERYRKFNCGLWGCVLQENNQLIGDCGITIQDIDDVQDYKIGYHFHRKYWNQGYATEAAICVKTYAFQSLGLNRICSYMAKNHIASMCVAEKNGMIKEKEFLNPNNRGLPTAVYAINR